MRARAWKSGARLAAALFALAVAGCSGGLLGGRSSSESAAAPPPPPPPRPAAVELSAIVPVPVILAALVSDDLATKLSRADQLALERATQTTLESVPIGTESRWNNAESGNSGTVTPTRTYQRASGQYCREFTQVIVLAGRREEMMGTACREPDGTWRKVAA